MALQKTKIIKGFEASYWRIVQFSANFDRNDAVVTLSLYKDKATRDTDPNSVLESYQIDLGDELHGSIPTGSDTIKNLKLKEAYTVFKAKAQAEAEKTEDKNEALAWFADATDDV